MKYFNELLESYNLLKKRKFKPTYLEEAKINGVKVDAESYQGMLQQTASTLASLAQQLGTSNGEIDVPGFDITGAPTTFKLKRGSKGINLVGSRFNAGSQAGIRVMDNDGNFVAPSTSLQSNVIGGIVGSGDMGGGSPGAVGGQQPQQGQLNQMPSQNMAAIPPEQMMAMPGYEDISPMVGTPYEDTKTIINFREIKEIAIESLWRQFPKKYRETGPWGMSDNEFSNYFSGSRLGSIESQLSKAVSLLKDETGVYFEGAAEVNTEMVKHISSNILETVKLASNTNITEDARRRIGNFFGVDIKGRVALFRDSSEEGLILNDRNGFLKNFIDFLADKHNVVINQVRYPNKDLAKDNQLRGQMLETSNLFLSLMQKSKQLNSPGHMRVANKVYETLFKGNILAFVQANYDWVFQAAETDSAIDIVDIPYYDELYSFIGAMTTNPERYLKGFISAHKNTLTRSPDLMIRSRKEVGFGLKADVTEGYFTYEAALEAAKNAGVDSSLIRPRSIKDLAASDPEVIQMYAEEGLLPPTGQVFTLGVSLKNYQSTKRGIKLGENTSHRVDAFINKSLDKLEPQKVKFQRNFRTVINASLGLNPLEVSEVIEIANKLIQIREIFNNPKRAFVKSTLGKNIDSRPAMEFVKRFKRQFRMSYTQQDINNDTLKKSISGILDKFESKANNYVDSFDRLSESVGRLHELTYLSSNSQDPKVKKYIAYKIFSLAGSIENTLVDARSLREGVSQVYENNKPLREFLGGFIRDNDNKRYSVQATSSGIRVVESLNPGKYLELKYSFRYVAGSYSSNYSVIISNDLGESAIQRNNLGVSL